MNIDEAIETLRVLHSSPLLYETQDYRDATNLGIEALKRLKRNRGYPHWEKPEFLPSEILEGLEG